MSKRDKSASVRIPLEGGEEIIILREPNGEIGVGFSVILDGFRRRNAAILSDEEVENVRRLLDG